MVFNLKEECDFLKNEMGIIGRAIKVHREVNYVDLLLSNGKEISSSLCLCTKPTGEEIINWNAEYVACQI